MSGNENCNRKANPRNSLIITATVFAVLLTAAIVLTATGTLHRVLYPNAKNYTGLEKLFASSTAYTTSLVATSSDNTERLYQAGVIARQARENSTDRTVYIKGINITIYKDQVDTAIALNALINSTDSKNQAVKSLLRREVLYHEALSKGYIATDKEISQLIADEKTALQKASNFSDFQEYLKGAGQTLDEYYESEFDFIKEETIISKYVQDLEKEYTTVKILPNASTEPTKPWNDKFNEIVLDLLRQENLQIFE